MSEPPITWNFTRQGLDSYDELPKGTVIKITDVDGPTYTCVVTRRRRNRAKGHIRVWMTEADVAA